MKKKIKNIIQKFGYNLEKIHSGKHPVLSRKIDLVLDVGANTGGFAKELRDLGYKDHIVSFEPVKQSHKKLEENSKFDKKWLVHKRCAIGNKNKKISINLSKNSSISSILSFNKSKYIDKKKLSYNSKEITTQIKLDSCFSKYSNNKKNIFLKIDVQGYEDKVLKGFTQFLKKIDMVQIELSNHEIYKNQKLSSYFFNFFYKRKFVLSSVTPVFFDKKGINLLQFDAIFTKFK